MPRALYVRDGRAVAMSGDRALRNLTIVDGFDNESLSEYRGDTGDYTTTTTDAIHGTAALERTTSTTGYKEMFSSSPVDKTISKPCIFEYKAKGMQEEGGDFCQQSIVFGHVDDNNYYAHRYEYEDDISVVTKDVDGSRSNLASTTVGANYTAGDVLTFVITWDDGSLGGTDGDITVKIYNEDKTVKHDEYSANSTSHSGTGFGMRSYAGADNTESYMDILNLVRP